jgi:hypothetical protein
MATQKAQGQQLLAFPHLKLMPPYTPTALPHPLPLATAITAVTTTAAAAATTTLVAASATVAAIPMVTIAMATTMLLVATPKTSGVQRYQFD